MSLIAGTVVSPKERLLDRHPCGSEDLQVPSPRPNSRRGVMDVCGVGRENPKFVGLFLATLDAGVYRCAVVHAPRCGCNGKMIR